jgi:hypothetical protein
MEVKGITHGKDALSGDKPWRWGIAHEKDVLSGDKPWRWNSLWKGCFVRDQAVEVKGITHGKDVCQGTSHGDSE